MHPLLASILFHAIGAASASVCYVPQRKLKGWSWQTYWLAQASFCWLLLPIVGAVLTVPDFWGVVNAAPRDALLRTFLLGAAYGIGGTAFGVAIRYVGFSITYATAIGVSTLVGTAYAIIKGNTGLANYAANIEAFWVKPGSGWVLLGICVGLVGIVFCGLAGRWKERDLNRAPVTPGKSNAVIGLVLCLLAGVLSGVYGMALTEGEPIAKLAESSAAGHTVLGVDATSFRNNAIYPFSNTGAFLTTAIYCLFLHLRHRTFSEMVALPNGLNPAYLGV
ncbi:MAG: L-rhamnose/proton symporter RhaT, partial [Verrucomicrobiales bacterium]|nr:L-rhamnose/proton symporter RhaT [Verrucomicrobiales bacterium]